MKRKTTATECIVTVIGIWWQGQRWS